MMNTSNLKKLASLIRYYILTATTAAGSGHPTSSLSATDLMTALMFGGFFRADLDNPINPNNDRLIFSKGHAAPLLYSLYTAAGKLTEAEIKTLRKFGSNLEGHPTLKFPYTEVATGSLGQGLSVGVGMAINAKYLDNTPSKTFVLLGDGEMAEGSNWEAVQIAAHYKLDNLIGLIDVSGLEQAGDSLNWHSKTDHGARNFYSQIKTFGWEVFKVNGHDVKAIFKTLTKALKVKNKPVMILSESIKGKGVSFIEGKNNWHGRALNQEELVRALKEIGPVDNKLQGVVASPQNSKLKIPSSVPTDLPITSINYSLGQLASVREAYGEALVSVGSINNNLVVLDAGVSNSTFAKTFKDKFPKRFFEMYIAEQNMVGVALGLSKRGKIPFVSTFGAFFSRAYDQIRMSQYSNANIKFVGSHVGVSIGEDGASQMGLEDLAMFRTIQNCVVLYPCDAISCAKLVAASSEHRGNVYLRSTREKVPVLYSENDEFKIGGSKVLRLSSNDSVTVVAAGITVHEALKAHDQLKKEGINVRVIDLYSIKPLDIATLKLAASETKNIITVEDHYAEGGLGEAVLAEIAKFSIFDFQFSMLAVRKIPHSGKPDELLQYEEISATAIVKKVKEIIK